MSETSRHPSEVGFLGQYLNSSEGGLEASERSDPDLTDASDFKRESEAAINSFTSFHSLMFREYATRAHCPWGGSDGSLLVPMSEPRRTSSKVAVHSSGDVGQSCWLSQL